MGSSRYWGALLNEVFKMGQQEPLCCNVQELYVYCLGNTGFWGLCAIQMERVTWNSVLLKFPQNCDLETS